MCLLTDTTKMKVATRDIKCYKVFQTFSSLTDSERATAIHKNGRGAFVPDTLVSPYQFTKYEIGKEYIEPGFSNYYQNMGYDDFIIGENAIHTFRNKKEAKKCAAFLRNCDIFAGGIIIVECVIPKGAIYALGKTGRYVENDNSYASNRLILKAIVPKEKK